jgi:hypothetical protein
MSVEASLAEYTKLDDSIKLLQQQLKEMKNQCNDIGEQILNHMTANKTDVITHGSGSVFKRVLKKSKSVLNKETIQESMGSLFKDSAFRSCKSDQNRAEVGAEYIMNTRKETEKYVLQRKAIK